MPANLFYPELPGGFLQYYRYGPFLRDRGVFLHVHTALQEHHTESDFEVNGIRVRRYPVPNSVDGFLEELGYLTERAIEAVKKSERQACLHPQGTSAANWKSISRLWKARMRGIPSCFHFTQMPVAEEGRIRRVRQVLSLKLLLSPYQRLLMCSREMGRAFQSLAKISGNRVRVIPNGIDLSVFHPVDGGAKAELRKRLRLPESDPVVLYVGSVIERKGVDILIAAWSRVLDHHPEARLLIVGSTAPRPTVKNEVAVTRNQQFVGRIHDLVESLPVSESVSFVAESDQIRDYYRASDLFVLASLQEGLPSVVLEAMACSLPCVVSPFIGIPADGEEYGIGGEHFVRSSHDPEKLAADICAQLEDPDKGRELGERGWNWIRESQEMGLAADRLAAVYREMLEVD